MPRVPRTDFEGAWHHVMNRGGGRRAIFENDSERERFLGCLAGAKQKYGLEVHCYCLMSNHYHLLVRSAEGRLSQAMSWLSSRFTQSLNFEKGRDGPVFRGRFTSILVSSNDHLVEASRYIHLNPVVAGLAAMPDEWKWSSAAAYLERTRKPQWLEVEFILGMFPENAGQRGYREYLNAATEAMLIKRYEGFMFEHGVRPAGSDPELVGPEIKPHAIVK